MIVIAPFFIKNDTFSICHDSTWTYVSDLSNCVVVSKIQGIPVAVSSDETILIIYSTQSSDNDQYIRAWDIDHQVFMSMDKLPKEVFAEHQKFFFKDFVITLDEPASVVFESIFSSQSSKTIPFSNKSNPKWNDSLSIGYEIYLLMHSPMFAIKGSTEYDADDYGFVSILDSVMGNELSNNSLLWPAPIMLNHIKGSSKLMLIAADGVQLIDNSTGDAEIIIEGKPFSRHYNWRGEAKVIDAAIHPSNAERIAILEHDCWYFMHLTSDGKWTKGDEYKLVEHVRRISLFDSGVFLFTERSLHIMAYDGQFRCKILLP